MSGGAQRSRFPGLEGIVRWLEQKRRTEAALLAAAAGGIGLIAVVAVAATGAAAYGGSVILLLLAGMFGEFFLGRGVSYSPVALNSVFGTIMAGVFASYLVMNWKQRRMEMRLPRSDSFDGILDNLLFLVREIAFIAPWLVDEALSQAVRAWRLWRLDVALCAQVLHLLASRNGPVPCVEIAVIIRGDNSWQVFAMLRQVDGVLFQLAEPRGLDLAPELRTELRKLLGGHRFKEAAHTIAGPPPSGDPWQVLGLRPGASMDEVKAAWRRAVKRCHPDRFASASKELAQLAEEQTKILNAAYEELLVQANTIAP